MKCILYFVSRFFIALPLPFHKTLSNKIANWYILPIEL
jgi:hypothetical protein